MLFAVCLMSVSHFLCYILHRSGRLYAVDSPIAIVGGVLCQKDNIGIGWACRVDKHDAGGAGIARNGDGTEGTGNSSEGLRKSCFWIGIFQILRILIIRRMRVSGTQGVTEYRQGQLGRREQDADLPTAVGRDERDDARIALTTRNDGQVVGGDTAGHGGAVMGADGGATDGLLFGSELGFRCGFLQRSGEQGIGAVVILSAQCVAVSVDGFLRGSACEIEDGAARDAQDN